MAARAGIDRITVNKMDAAKRQLHTAIQLWFRDADPVSIHTLVSAAHEVIHTLFRRAGLKGLLFDAPSIPDGLRSEISQALVRAAVFFKHARHDPEGTIEFAPGINTYLIMYCVFGLWRIGAPLALEEGAIWTWLALHRPDWFASQIREENFPPNARAALAQLPKHELLQQFTNLWNTDAEFRRRMVEGAANHAGA